MKAEKIMSRQRSRIEREEKVFSKRVKGYTGSDRIIREDIRKELEMESLSDEITRYSTKWKEQADRMPKGAMKHKPGERRNVERHRQRWKCVRILKTEPTRVPKH